MAGACAELLLSSRVAAVYVLDEEGKQCGPNMMGKGGTLSPLFAPLQNVDGANWSRRPYFNTAALNPGSIKIGTPYFSQADAFRCMTLSIAVYKNAQMFVLCCDLMVAKLDG